MDLSVKKTGCVVPLSLSFGEGTRKTFPSDGASSCAAQEMLRFASCEWDLLSVEQLASHSMASVI